MKRTKGMQVQPLRADAVTNTEGQVELDNQKKMNTLSEDSGSTPESTDMDCDISKDYVPSDSTSSSDDEEQFRKLLLHTTRKLILKNPIEYIGLRKNHLHVVDELCNHVSYKERGQIISVRDVIFIVLMTIRTGEEGYMIADRFGVSKSCVSRILTRFVPVISGCLKEFIIWPQTESIRKWLPHSFKAFHYNVESIIDCFEIQIEKPSAAMTQSMTWSDYKKCNTVKYLGSVTPDGMINFISHGKPDRCSDMELLRGSGYLDCLRPGSTVLADRGFKEIEADLAARGCFLARPASISQGEQLSSKVVLNMKIVAGLRIHVERAIRRIRVHKFLDMHSFIPLSMMDLLDSIVIIACGLVNLQEPICKI